MDKAKQYSNEKYILFFVGTGISFLFLVFFQIFASAEVKSLTFSWSGQFYISILFYVLIFSVINYWFGFPIHFYETFFIEHKYQLSNQTFWDWLKDEFKKNAISSFVFILFVMLFYFMLKNTGQYWWLVLAICWLAFSVFLSRIMPTFIVPLFYNYSNVENPELKKSINDLAALSGIKILDVFKINLSKKTKKANAAVIGIGASRRVVLADTLIDNFSEEEILSVCAHEFGHHKLSHMPRLIIFSMVSTTLSFYLLNICMQQIVSFFNAQAIYDVSVFPSFLLVLYLFSLIMMPIQNGYSRALETQADLFALQKTDNKEAFKSVMDKLGKMNLADIDPPKIFKYLFYSHPPIKERIEFADEYGKKA